MSRSHLILALVLAPALMVAGGLARAAELGPILLSSPAGEPLQGLVSLQLGAGETEEELAVTLGSPAEYGWLEIARPPWIDDLQLHVTSEEGEPRVRLWSADSPPDRRFSLLLVVSSPASRSLRQYDIVLRDAEVLLAPAERGAAAELPVQRPGGVVSTDPGVADSAPARVARPARRAMQVGERANAQVQRNLTISSATGRLAPSALERRAQRLEETAAAQQRALGEANSRIVELQGQLEKLEKLLALKGAAPAVADASSTKPAEAAKPTEVAKSAEVVKPVDAAKPGEAAKPDEAVKPNEPAPAAEAPPVSAAAPMVEVEQPTPAPPAPAPVAPAAVAPPAEPEDDGLTSLLLTVAGVVAALLAATLAALWWRRRRARQTQLAQEMAAAAAGAETGDAAAEPDSLPEAVAEVPPELPAEAQVEPVADSAAQAAAIDQMDTLLTAAIDAPLGAPAAADVPVPVPDTPVASLEALTAAPAAPDDLDALFSEEAIAAAQAAIQSTAAEPPVAAAPRVDEAAGEPVAPPPAADADADDEDEDVDDAANEADLEDVEVNLAKAYIDMGDPDGARAILEGMMADSDNPERAALARRTMRRFGIKRSPPPAEVDAAAG